MFPYHQIQKESAFSLKKKNFLTKIKRLTHEQIFEESEEYRQFILKRIVFLSYCEILVKNNQRNI